MKKRRAVVWPQPWAIRLLLRFACLSLTAYGSKGGDPASQSEETPTSHTRRHTRPPETGPANLGPF